MALNEIDVRKVHKPQNATNSRDSPMPAMPTILQIHKPKKSRDLNLEGSYKTSSQTYIGIDLLEIIKEVLANSKIRILQ